MNANPHLHPVAASPPVPAVVDVTGNRRWMKIGTWMVVVKSVAFLLLAALLLYPSTTKGLENDWFDPSGGVAFALAALLSVAPVCSLAAVAVAWSCRVGAPNFAQATIWFANGVMFVQTVAVIAPVILILMLPSPT